MNTYELYKLLGDIRTMPIVLNNDITGQYEQVARAAVHLIDGKRTLVLSLRDD